MSEISGSIYDTIVEEYPGEEILVLAGYNDAIVGFDDVGMRVIYSEQKILDILVSEGESYVDAMEHYYFNIKGSYVGERTPIFMVCSFE